MATFDSKTIVMMAENGHSVEIEGQRIQFTIVQEAVKAKPDYSHLVGKWVKCVRNENKQSDNPEIKSGKYYPVSRVDGDNIFIVDEKEIYAWYVGDSTPIPFDLSNPLDHNPDDVRVFDVLSEIRISEDSDGLSLFFSDHQALWYSKTLNCYGVILTPKNAHTPIPCIATECKFEDLQEGDLFFATDDEKPDFTSLVQYSFLNNDKGLVWTDGRTIDILIDYNFNHYFKITPKP